MLVNRLVGFGRDGKAIAAGFGYAVDTAPVKKVIALPALSCDFIAVDVRGKTEAELKQAAEEFERNV